MNYGKIATTLAQKYARLRLTDEHGYGWCCTCGKLLEYGTQQCQGGHFHAKGRHYNGACCMEENINLQCAGCNSFGNVESQYAKYMMDTYGKRIINKIAKESKKVLTKEEFQDIIAELKVKIKEIAKTKMFLVK